MQKHEQKARRMKLSKIESNEYQKEVKLKYRKMNRGRVVTKIEELDKKRSKIYINQEFAFVLYKGEITQYKIQIEKEIDSNTYNAIKKELLPERAKKRCLNLLQKRPYTECKLREKLTEGHYPQDIIDEAIDYVKSFHYIDDYDYACQYIFYHKESETRRNMEEKLMQKGIDKETLRKAMEDSYDEEEQQEIELQQARKWLDKKKYDAETMDWKEKQRIYAFLIRKGISISIVRKVMSVHDSGM